MNFGDQQQSTVRLKMLRLLRKSGMAINHEAMQIALESMGIRMSMDQVRAEMVWLGDMGTVTLLPVAHLTVAEITDKGNDVAKGVSRVPGIDVFVPGAGL
jgi:repressor of nif and glnA expression